MSSKIQPQDSQDGTVFMSMYNDIDWTKKEKKETLCVRNSSDVSECARILHCREVDVLGPGDVEKRYGTLYQK